MTMPVRAGLLRMRPRDPREPHRAASTLELFFDLTFVVGVSVTAHELLLAEEHGLAIRVGWFLLSFFGIWWPWVNFTWFASAFDTDDWLYRVLTIVQMGGVLVTAAGVAALVEHADARIAVVGYVIMRLALVAQWLRASRDPGFRATALRYAGGVAVVQAAWALLLVVPSAAFPFLFLLFVACEFAVPVWAERPRVTPFHRHHIAERYGLFTLIVLGEGLLSVTNALIDAQRSEGHAADLVLVGVTALVLIAGMWWLYFARQAPVLQTGMRGTFAFGYVHYLVFGSAAALASGIELSIASLDEGPEGVGVLAATTVPVAVFVLASWFLVLRRAIGPVASVAIPALGVLIGLAALLPAGLQIAALLVVAIVVLLEIDGRRGTAA